MKGLTESMASAIMGQCRDEVQVLTRDMMHKIEAWTAERGFTPADRASALALIDELKARGVKSFDGLGIKVEL